LPKPAWFDDLRIQPFNSTMTAFVFDPNNLRQVAKLDGQNFFTGYEYDARGALQHTKRETERGVVTLQEIRSGKPH
jgi:hypothetical protein